MGEVEMGWDGAREAGVLASSPAGCEMGLHCGKTPITQGHRCPPPTQAGVRIVGRSKQKPT